MSTQKMFLFPQPTRSEANFLFGIRSKGAATVSHSQVELGTLLDCALKRWSFAVTTNSGTLGPELGLQL